MILFDLLKHLEPTFSENKSKVHLARFNGSEHPLDVFVQGQGNFDEWQSWQDARNFQREFVVSLIQAGSPTRWLFAGLFRVNNCEERNDPTHHFSYNMERVSAAEDWVGRLYLTSCYKQRNSYLLGETLADDLVLAELQPNRLSIGQFPGYKNINITKGQLEIVISQNIESWRSALSSVKGIYLITDTKTGKLYVGKADGEDGIWGRWSVYSATNHGHNVKLKSEFGIDALPERKNDLRFSLLEIADLNAMEHEINERESHWKDILMSRVHGYNGN